MPLYRFLPVTLLVLVAITMAGCYNKSLRHLSSDASLIKVGKSSKNDVLIYLGEPDKERVLADGQEEWAYIEEKPSGYQRTPLIGGFFSGNGYDNILVVFKDDIVESCKFREYDEDEFDWADDFSWQETNE